MHIIRARNVSQAYYEALFHMKCVGQIEESRNGKVMVAPYPVATAYYHPEQRMLFDVDRDANPFFHIVEAIWMLAGQNDVKTVARFASNMANFSDDGETLEGAYGYRWHHYFGLDQVLWIVDLLKEDPTTRRAVISMYDPSQDGNSSRDVPCNTHIYFRIKDGNLDMTVCCRSNDIIWGCYGANAVHMSVLQEFIANYLGIPLGVYYQVSNNWHVYERHFNLVYDTNNLNRTNPYDFLSCHVPILGPEEFGPTFLVECRNFLTAMNEGHEILISSNYLTSVVQPLIKTWDLHKSGHTDEAISLSVKIKDSAVATACFEWLNRRLK